MPRREKRAHQMGVYTAILSLKNADESFAFFKDICSDNELLAIEQRFRVAQMLAEGRTYLDIQNETNASTATISRVARMLSDGTGVVGDVIERMK